MDDVGTVVKAIHDYSYDAEQKDGTKRHVRFRRGDRFLLLKKSNIEWWDVIQYDQDPGVKHFYIPAKYVEQLDYSVNESNHPGKKLNS
jgi:hypothetical protein